MKNSASSGISFTTLLGLLFIALKLTGVIDWSWFWVLAPFWAGLALILGFFVLGAIILSIIAAFSSKKVWTDFRKF